MTDLATSPEAGLASAPANPDQPASSGPAPASADPRGALDPRALAADFPILEQRPHGKRLVYLDAAATSQKPRVVIEAMDRYYREYNANVHRAIYEIGERATQEYEGARAKVARLINAPAAHEIVWTRNATESINLVAYSC